MDLAIQTSVPEYDKGIGVRVGGGCARNDHAGETLSANRLNGCFQSRLCSHTIL